MPLQPPESVDRISTMPQPAMESLPVPTVSNLHIKMPGIFKMGKSKVSWEVLQTECYSRIESPRSRDRILDILISWHPEPLVGWTWDPRDQSIEKPSNPPHGYNPGYPGLGPMLVASITSASKGVLEKPLQIGHAYFGGPAGWAIPSKSSKNYRLRQSSKGHDVD